MSTYRKELKLWTNWKDMVHEFYWKKKAYGEITQEEFDEIVKSLDEEKPIKVVIDK